MPLPFFESVIMFSEEDVHRPLQDTVVDLSHEAYGIIENRNVFCVLCDCAEGGNAERGGGGFLQILPARLWFFPHSDEERSFHGPLRTNTSWAPHYSSNSPVSNHHVLPNYI